MTRNSVAAGLLPAHGTTKAGIESLGVAAARDKGDGAAALPWHKLATGVLRQPWSSLVVVPAGRETSSVEVARALTEALRCQGAAQTTLVDACGVAPALVGVLLAEVKSAGPASQKVVSVDSFLASPAAISIALAAEAALMCVTLGETNVGSARETIEIIRGKTLGCVVLRPRGLR